jgi:hypothetical protein
VVVYAVKLSRVEKKQFRRFTMTMSGSRRHVHITQLAFNIVLLFCTVVMHSDWTTTVATAATTCLLYQCVDTRVHPAWHGFSIGQAAVAAAWPSKYVVIVITSIGVAVHAVFVAVIRPDA